MERVRGGQRLRLDALLLQAGKLENVLEDCERYLSQFPRGKYVLEMAKWQGEARRGAVMSGRSASVPASQPGDEDEAE